MSATARRGVYAMRHRPGAGSLVFAPILVQVVLIGGEAATRRAGYPTLAAIGGFVAYVLWAWWVVDRARWAGFDVREFVRSPTRADWRALWVVPVLFVSAVAGRLLAIILLSFAFPTVVEGVVSGDASAFGQTPVALIVRSVQAVVIAPFVEEFLFRGILLHLWAPRFGLMGAAVYSSLFFALLHADPLGTIVFGIVLSAVYIRTQSLVLPIVAHAAANAVVTIGSLVSSGSERGTLADLRDGWGPMTAIFVATLFMLIPGVYRTFRDGSALPHLGRHRPATATAAATVPSSESSSARCHWF